MQYPKIKQERLSDVVARELEKLIFEGVLKPGDRLPPERELAQEFDVSRPSLREALQKLESVGLLETRHGGGTFVKDAIGSVVTDPLGDVFQRHPEAAVDFIELRSTLDGVSAYYAAVRGTDADRAILSERFRAMEAAHKLDDPTDEAEADADFHIAIAEASHNIILLHVIRSMMTLLRGDVVFNRMLLYSQVGARDALLDQHRAVYDAIMAGDGEAARYAAQAHMAHVQAVLETRDRQELRSDVSQRRLARLLSDKKHNATKPTIPQS
ncbi:MAG: FCD domain-containing protein [Hyphomicrobiales bacterium]|nr:FCD domain-containing protein [Hyphomicrobiales bacterium]